MHGPLQVRGLAVINLSLMGLKAGGKLSRGRKTIPLDPLHIAMQVADVTVEDNFAIGAESEVEIVCNVISVMEPDHLFKKPQVLIARAIVTPQQKRIPMRVLNLKTEPL